MASGNPQCRKSVQGKEGTGQCLNSPHEGSSTKTITRDHSRASAAEWVSHSRASAAEWVSPSRASAAEWVSPSRASAAEWVSLGSDESDAG